MTAPLRNQLVLAQENIGKVQRTGIMLFTNRAYTKHQDIHDQESVRRSGFLYSALQSPIRHCVVTAVTFVARLSPKGKLRKPRRDFRLQTSDFRLQTSDFRLQTSDFRLQTSDFRLRISDFGFQTSDFRLQTSDLRLSTLVIRPPACTLLFW